MPESIDPFKSIANMEAKATTINSNDKRKQLVNEMNRYTEAVLGEPRGIEAKATHIGRSTYNGHGELIGFYLEPLNKFK